MLKVDEFGNISITQGDSGVIKQPLYTDETLTEIFHLSDGESIVFSVRMLAGGEPIIQKKTSEQHADGSVLFYFTASETEALARGEYIYDTALISDNLDKKSTYAGGDEVKLKFSVV